MDWDLLNLIAPIRAILQQNTDQVDAPVRLYKNIRLAKFR